MGNTKEKAAKTYSLRVTENALQNIDDITGYIAFIKHQPLNARASKVKKLRKVK
jgi:hypothetical protein